MSESIGDGALHAGIRFRLQRTLQSIASRGDTDRAEDPCGETPPRRTTHLQNIVDRRNDDVTRLNECVGCTGALEIKRQCTR